MEDPDAYGFRSRPYWLLAVVFLAAGQTGLALLVFGGWSSLVDDRPIISGRHPLHFYHGLLGAETFYHRQSTACYDPNFQAGYPKTPVFDAGSRPAELFLVLAGSRAGPGAYKIGLFACCVLVPIIFVIAARGASLTCGGACLAGLAGCIVWWSPPVRAMFNEGDIDLLFAGLCAMTFIAWLPRYHWEPGVISWLALAVTAVAGWFAHPVVWLGLTPLFAIYYVALAPRHGPAWHLGLAGVTWAGLGLNIWWLWDWGKFWWLRQPSVDDIAPWPTWGALLGTPRENAALLGEDPLGWPTLLLALVGILWMVYLHQRTTAALILFSGLSAALVARLGQVWPTLMAGGTDRAAPFVAAIAMLPIAAVLSAWWEATRPGRAVILVLLGLPVFMVLNGGSGSQVAQMLRLNLTPIPMGLTEDQSAFAQGLVRHTTPDARILMEDDTSRRLGWNWTALLPLITERYFLGGIDHEACVEHAFCGMRQQRLNGRLLEDWTDDELSTFCHRYNVGWVVCRTPEARTRWEAYPQARLVETYTDDGPLALFAIDRKHSYVLVGSAEWTVADRKKVILSNVVPVEPADMPGLPPGMKMVVLSLHHQHGFRVSPSTVHVERDPDPYDPISMVRLTMQGPMSRIIITWENP